MKIRTKKTLANRIVDQAIHEMEREHDTGCCLMCGAWHDGVEPDARYYLCDECGESAVFGAEEIVLMLGSFAS